MGTPMTDRALLDAILRTDFPSFVAKVFEVTSPGEEFEAGWLIEAICYELMNVAAGKTTRQIIAVPPRSLKSICASVALPAWLLGHDPTRKIICVSYSMELSAKHSADCRAVMKSDWYRRIFPASQISAIKDTESYFRTTRGGYRDATSVGGTLTGKGGSLIIVDDPLKPDDALSEAARQTVNYWYDRTLVTRLNNKLRDGIIIVMQRLHLDDLIGHVTRDEVWSQLILPAKATAMEIIPVSDSDVHIRYAGEVVSPEREPPHILRQLERRLGAFSYAAQYQQNPIPVKGGIVQWPWFRFCSMPPSGIDRYIHSWDFAAKATEFGSYSVGTVWAVKDGCYYLVDLFRKRLAFPALMDAIIDLCRIWPAADVLIEDAAAGASVLETLRFTRPSSMPHPRHIAPERDKVTRLHTASAPIEQGRVFLAANAPWLDALRDELAQFPNGSHSDQADSISQFINWAEHRRFNKPGITRLPMFGSRTYG